MKKSLRYYQEIAIIDTRKFFSKGGNSCLLCSPTGTGKTFMFSVIAKMTADNKKKTLVCTHRDELLNQSGGSLIEQGLSVFNIANGVKYLKKDVDCFVAMAQTLSRRIDKKQENELFDRFVDLFKDISLIIIDECHLQHFNFLFESGLINRFGIKVIGVTATPVRGGKQRQLGVDYEEIIYTISVKKAVEKGYLMPCQMSQIQSVSTDGVAIDAKTGDFNATNMFSKFNNSKLYSGLVDNYKEIAPDTKSLVFCCNKEHVMKTTLMLHDKGYNVKYLISAMSKPRLPDMSNEGKVKVYKEKMRIYNLYLNTKDIFSGDRKDVINWHNETPKSLLVNAGILTTGYDCPNLETIIIYRLVRSLSEWLQIMGRGSRPCPQIGKTDFNVIYFGDNIEKDLCYYEEDVEFSLWHNEGKSGGIAPQKFCGHEIGGKPIINDEGEKGCRRMIPTCWTICQICGYKYAEKKEVEAKLVSVSLDGDKRVVHKHVSKMSIPELVEHREKTKKKVSWLWRQLFYRGGRDGIISFAKSNNYKPKTLKLALDLTEKWER